MSNTADRLLDAMQSLIQSRGYNAVSYQDLSERVGIRKASIHYHFPTKHDLGIAVIRRYREDLNALLRQVRAEQTDWSRIIRAYYTPYRTLAGSLDLVCLCGALSGEYPALPDGMRAEVSRFFSDHQAWLEETLQAGRAAGAFHFEDPPEEMARLFLSALQGALLVKRAHQDHAHVEAVIKILDTRIGLLPDAGGRG